jgi:glycosyltransferase involved in cell wall biosynthesis
MRVLFLHAAKESTGAPEYSVHRLYAENVDPVLVDCAFVWQDSALRRPAILRPAGRNFFCDFGRDLSLLPRPSRAVRASMMLLRLPGALAFVSATLRAFQPALIYTSQQQHDVRLGWLISRRFHIPHVIHAHYPLGPVLGRDVLLVMRAGATLIAVSDFVRQGAIRQGVPPERVRTLWNPAPTVHIPRAANPQAIRAEFGWPPEAPLVVAAGRLDPSKGHRTLFDAFTQVHAELPAARLLVCGASTTRDHYERVLWQRVCDLGLQESVAFSGHRNDLHHILASADLFCLPTENEAFGLVFLEAMAAALPVVACRSGAVPEIVLHGETGLLSEENDAGAVAANLLALLRNRDMARRLGEAGRARCEAVFAADLLARRWAELLAEVIIPK